MKNKVHAHWCLDIVNAHYLHLYAFPSSSHTLSLSSLCNETVAVLPAECNPCVLVGKSLFSLHVTLDVQNSALTIRG